MICSSGHMSTTIGMGTEEKKFGVEKIPFLKVLEKSVFRGVNDKNS
jgi:hypothetical protein